MCPPQAENLGFSNIGNVDLKGNLLIYFIIQDPPKLCGLLIHHSTLAASP